MIVIADSGSSKTDWRIIGEDKISQYNCKGLNPDFNNTEDVRLATQETFENKDVSIVQEVYFYGSGCSSAKRNKVIEVGLEQVFKKAKIFVDHDLLGAARAACGKQEGLIGILGTGSNCCLFDGKEITREYRTGGYIVGDEGGGVDMGKRIIKHFIEEKFPKDLHEVFLTRYKLSVDDILESMYKKEYPNRFLASFSRFAFHHKEHPFMAKLIYDSLLAYFEEQVLRYPEATKLPLSLVGSISFYYQEFIRKVAAEKGVQIGTILEKPISGLSLYHANLS